MGSIRLTVVVAIGLVAAVWAGGASADGLSCGATISSNVTLQKDMVCWRDGLVIEARPDQRGPIVLNLNGHTIRGAGAGTGVFIDAPATVRNGTISGFGTGVFVNGWSGILLSYLVVTHNGVGVFDETNGAVTVGDSAVSENASDGITGFGPTGVISLLVTRTTVAKNGGDGLRFAFTDGWAIDQSTLLGNVGDGLFSDDSSGVISASTASHNGGSGVYIHDDYGGSVFNHVTNVLAEANGDWGIAHDVLPPIPPYDGGGNRANHNGNPAQCLNIVCQ
jgi:hypothetical protein